MSNYSNLYKRIQEAENLPRFTPHILSNHFRIPSNCFIEMDDNPNVILAYKRHKDRSAEGFLLKGTFFFKNDKRIVRGYPKILYGRTHQESIPFARQAETELLSCLKTNPIKFEEKVDGINIRVYKRNSKYYFATRKRYDGSPRIGNIQWGKIAKRILDSKYPKAYDLVKAGFMPVFEITSPLFDHLVIKSETEDAFLVDVVDENHMFVDREVREEMADFGGFKLPRIIKTVEGPISDKAFRKLYKSLEYYAESLGIEGMVSKSRRTYEDGAKGDQVFLKIVTNDVRKAHRGYVLPKRCVDATVLKVIESMNKEELQDLGYVVEFVEEELAEEFGISNTLTDHIWCSVKNLVPEKLGERLVA